LPSSPKIREDTELIKVRNVDFGVKKNLSIDGPGRVQPDLSAIHGIPSGAVNEMERLSSQA
jgi:hypothetical protein